MRLLMIAILMTMATAASAQTLNQCRDGFSCSSIATDDVQGSPFDADGTESFTTHLDIDGTLSLDRCSWEWQAFYDPAVVSYASFIPNYSPAFGVIGCSSGAASPPIGFPDHTEQVVCAMTKTGPGPPSFAPSFSDVTLSWDVLEGPDADSAIVAGGYTFSVDTLGPCLEASAGTMNTDLEFSVVPEPAFASSLIVGLLALLLAAPASSEDEETIILPDDVTACEHIEDDEEFLKCVAEEAGAPIGGGR